MAQILSFISISMMTFAGTHVYVMGEGRIWFVELWKTAMYDFIVPTRIFAIPFRYLRYGR